MNQTLRPSLAPIALLLVAALSCTGCQGTPAPTRAEISGQVTASAEVVAIEPASRLLTLRREDGLMFQLHAGDEVRNFAQVAVGDHLRVRYAERLAASRRPEGEAARPMDGAFAAGRARAGDKPGVGMGVDLSVRVRIESIDLARAIVVFSLASGELVAHRIATPEGRAFVAGLSIGDTVQLDYTEALAISIEKL